MSDLDRKEVVIPSAEYHRLLREDGKAGQLAAYILGVLTAGKINKSMAETIKTKCGQYYPV